MTHLPTLTELFVKHGTDKQAPAGQKGHQYGAVYDRLLSHKRETVTSVLEIGVLGGASLRAWLDFFPNAKVIGLDCFPKSLAELGLAEYEGRVQILRGEQQNPWEIVRKLESYDAKFDLIVDDGSHCPLHQLLTLTIVRRLLFPSGIMVVEDIRNEAYWNALATFVPDAEKIDTRGVSINSRADDLLLVAHGPGNDPQAQAIGIVNGNLPPQEPPCTAPPLASRTPTGSV